MKKISSNAIEEKTTRADELEVLEPDAADSETTRPTDPTCTTVAHCIVENSADGGSSSPVAEEANMIADTNAIIDNSSTLMMNDSANNMDSIPDTPHNPKASVVSPIVVESLSIPAEKKLEEEEVMAHDICTNAPHDSPHTVHDQPLHKIHPSPSEAVPLTPSWRQQTSSPALRLLSLPVDSLHCIASFLTASDWAKFGQTTTIATPICRDVFTRVRMHGFRCATEVVTAWKLGQHADARELSALYIQAGVPIYPLSLGHSYHTLVWRMGVEARDLEQKQASSDQEAAADDDGEQQHQQANNDNDEPQSRPVDPFFAQRYDAQGQGGDEILNSTYLEEKCIFSYNKAAENDSRLGIRVSMTSRTSFAPPAPVLGAGWDGRTRLPDFRPAAGDRSPPQHQQHQRTPPATAGTLAYSDASRIPPKVQVKLHRHLVDQYVLGSRAIDDDRGAMVASPISLAADFFHHSGRGITETNAVALFNEPQQAELPVEMVRLPIMPSPSFDMSAAGASSRFSLGARVDDRIDFGDEMMIPVGEEGNNNFADTQLSDREPPPPPELTSDPSTDGSNSPTPSYATPLQQSLSASLLASPPPPPPVPTPDELSSNDLPLNADPPVLSGIDLEVYNSANILSDHRDGAVELKNHLKARFAVTQRNLETVLSQNDSCGFEECLLDFWDEFLPVTANIHFHDRNTAVPRISGLQQFLSKPCPQALGIVQCEIERIKVNSKRKGVNMKGRLFPSYEYRLFIRDRRHDAAAAESPAGSRNDDPARRDTVMMTAKNRGRKHQESAGVLPAPGASKKGVNNYYLYMPQHADVDTHYRAVNSNSASPAIVPNGASGDSRKTPGNDSTVLLGRLQSNFIGTEFQIFTPTVQKHPVVGHKIPGARHPASSDSESDYDGASSDNTSTVPRRRNRFHRRRSNPALMRRSNRENASELGHQPQPISEEESMDGSPSRNQSRTKRAYSLPNFSYRKSTRSNRRAVANSVDPQDSSQNYPPLLYEEEDGAITYTANLLGNRPRIMDVCVPKVSNEGVAGAEWNRYLGSVEDSSDTSGNSMLNHFRQLQQRLENPFNNNPVAAATVAANANGVNAGSAANGEQNEEEEGQPDYTPPDDFGLLALQNRPPWWNVELGAFVLNFGGRVSVASVKNFQLCDRNDQDHIMLQFGRIQGRHSFTMDFQHPLTAVQAFAIAISSLQSRISFG